MISSEEAYPYQGVNNFCTAKDRHHIKFSVSAHNPCLDSLSSAGGFMCMCCACVVCCACACVVHVLCCAVLLCPVLCCSVLCYAMLAWLGGLGQGCFVL